MELTRRVIDLFFVSVLLDAGAGDRWRYVEPGTDKVYERSEGIAVASLYMFKDLEFSSKKQGDAAIVDGERALASTLYTTTNHDGYRARSRAADERSACERVSGIRK
jgi:hypothetical protein